MTRGYKAPRIPPSTKIVCPLTKSAPHLLDTQGGMSMISPASRAIIPLHRLLTNQEDPRQVCVQDLPSMRTRRGPPGGPGDGFRRCLPGRGSGPLRRHKAGHHAGSITVAWLPWPRYNNSGIARISRLARVVAALVEVRSGRQRLRRGTGRMPQRGCPAANTSRPPRPTGGIQIGDPAKLSGFEPADREAASAARSL